jgi:nucleotide-binding universal stress UspA family protein
MRILIATDGSAFSRAAVEKCCKLVAGAEDASILVVAAYEDTYQIATEPFAISAEFYQHIVDTAQKQAEQFADDAVETLRRCMCSKELDISTRVVKGAPERQIVDEAREWRADLIVVGSHGRGFWGRLTLGSVTDAVIHHAPCSVLVVRNCPTTR